MLKNGYFMISIYIEEKKVYCLELEFCVVCFLLLVKPLKVLPLIQ